MKCTPGVSWHVLQQMRARLRSPASQYRLSDLRARAWGRFGNSLRVCGRISESEEALAAGFRDASESGSGDPMLRARLNEQISSLYIFQKRFADALDLDAGAVQIYRDLGDSATDLREPRSQEAIVLDVLGRVEPGQQRSWERAIPLIEPGADPSPFGEQRRGITSSTATSARIAQLSPKWLTLRRRSFDQRPGECSHPPSRRLAGGPTAA